MARVWQLALLLTLSLWLAACGTSPATRGGSAPGTSGSRTPSTGPYATDGALPNAPADLAQVPDAEPKVEPQRSGGPNKPYQVAGESYVPLTDDRPVVERGLASWYGRKFHGRPTASGELYNMYAMTAAHPTLPIPSYARVRNPANGREVIVRVNDRGPFSKGRIVDLSYTAALKLDVLRGVTPVELERITHEAIRTGSWRRTSDAEVARSDTPAQALLPPTSEPATPAPGSPVRQQRDLWAQDLSLDYPPPAAGPTPLPQADAMTSDGPGRGVSVRGWPTSPTAPTALPLPPALPLPGEASQGIDGRGVNALPSGTAITRDPVRTEAGRGWWVQLGAFRERSGALDFQQEMARLAPWMAPLLALFDERGLHKLQAGPFPAKAEAQSAMQRMKESVRLSPLLVERR